MMRGTMRDVQMWHMHDAVSRGPNVNTDSSATQKGSMCKEHESAAVLNNCLNKYLHSLGYCAKKRHLRWLV